mgnify:FL=1
MEGLVTLSGSFCTGQCNRVGVTVTVDEPDDEGVTVYHLHVSENDMGRVIGKQGRIAKAIRTVMRAAATRCDEKVAVEID